MTNVIIKIVVGLLIATPGLLAAAGNAGNMPALPATVFSVVIVGGLCVVALGLSDLIDAKKSGSS